MFSTKKLDLITLGDELLLGIRQNSHLVYIGSELGRHGLALRRNLTCRDQEDEIEACFSQAWETADIVITTGGLGPTSDDNTREVVARVLGRKLVYVPAIEDAIRSRFERLGRKMSSNNLKQCYIPEGAEVLPNPNGTAPGIYLKVADKLLIMLPGPTPELRPMFETEVMPRLCREGLCSHDDSYLQLRAMGLGESQLDELVRPFTQRNPHLQVAFCAHQGMVDIRLSGTPGSGLTHARLKEIATELRNLLGEDYVCCGHAPLAKIIFDHLRADEKTLSVAESCTGGLLANAFTDIPGASKVFVGGVVCYNNDTKMEMLDVPECLLQQHGAVSAECAIAMAVGAAERFSSDYALSITGFAGPSGGTPENPVGTIFIGYYSPCGAWSVRKTFLGERQVVKVRAVNHALDVMRRKLNKYKVEDAIARLSLC